MSAHEQPLRMKTTSPLKTLHTSKQEPIKQELERPEERAPKLKEGVVLYATHDPEYFYIGTPRARVGFRSLCARAIFDYIAANLTLDKSRELLAQITQTTSHTEIEIQGLITELSKSGLIERQQSVIQIPDRYISAIKEKAKRASEHTGDAALDQLKKKIEPELVQSRWVQGVEDSGISIINQRHLAHIEISGHSRAATQLFALLLASGVTHTQFGLGYRPDATLICDTDIEAGPIRSTDLGKTFKTRAHELSKEIVLLPLEKLESAEEVGADFKEQTLKVHFGEIDPVTQALWMSAGQQHLIIGEVTGASLRIGPIVRPGITPCSRCVDLLECEQSGAVEQITRSGKTSKELPVIAAHFLASLVASIILQLIDGDTCDLFGSILFIDLLSLCSTEHIPIARHPSCGCDW